MAVPEQTPYIEYTANGVATRFALGFGCESKDHLIVTLDGVEPPVGNWSLTDGEVVFTTAPSNGVRVVIQRNTPFSRTTDYQSYNNSFRPQSVNGDFDRLWLKLQELGVADWLMKLYVDRLHQQQEQEINDLKDYVDDRDDELRAYLMEEIRKQGVALDQLDDYYNYLMQRLAQIAVDKGWGASFILSADGSTQQQINDRVSNNWYEKPLGYELNSRAMLANGDIVKSINPNNTNNPNNSMAGWLSEIETSVGGVHINEFLSNAELRDAMKSSPVLDHTQAWRKAVAACPENGTIVGDPKHTYNIKIQSDGWNVLIEKSIKIDMRGAKVIYKPWSDANPAGVHTPAFFFRGSTNAKIAIDRTLVRHNVIKCSDVSKASEFAAGDYVFVYSDALYKQWNYPETTYGSNQFSGVGELQQIESVNTVTGEIKLSRITENPYYSQAYVQKLNPLINPSFTNVSNATEIDANVISSKPLGADCGHFVSFDVCVNPKMSENSVLGHRMFVGWMGRCWQALVDRTRSFVTNALYPPIGGHAYCIRHQHSFGAVSRQNFGFQSRHTIDYTSSHSCSQSNNVAIRNEASYLLHGFFERIINSKNDVSMASVNYAGFVVGNTSFNAAYDVVIDGFKGTDKIAVICLSENVEIISPQINSPSRRPVEIKLGAKNVRIHGDGFLKSTGEIVGPAIICMATQDYSSHLGGDLKSATATSGVDKTVTLVMQSAHGRTVGSGIYVNFMDSPLIAEWGGYYTVASTGTTTVAGDTLTYVRTGTTVSNLSFTGSRYGTLYKAGDFKPVSDVSIKDVTVSSVGASSLIEASCEGSFKAVDVKLQFTASSQKGVTVASSMLSKKQDSFTAKDNEFMGAHVSGIDLGVSYPKKLIIKGNTDTEYTDSFLRTSGTAADINGLNFTNNTLNAAAPTDGVVNFNLWDCVKKGAIISGNTYPVNAVVTHATNKNWEYGTWMPSLIGETTAGTATYALRLGHYQLDGRSLKIKGRLQVSAFTGVGQMQITGIPCSNNGYAAPVATAETDLVFTGQLMPTWVGTFIRLRQSNAGNIENVPVKANLSLVFHSTLDLTSS